MYMERRKAYLNIHYIKNTAKIAFNCSVLRLIVCRGTFVRLQQNNAYYAIFICWCILACPNKSEYTQKNIPTWGGVSPYS